MVKEEVGLSRIVAEVLGRIKTQANEDQYSSQRGLYNSSQRHVSVSRSKSQHISNPFDAEGNIMWCHECDSTKHFLMEDVNCNMETALAWAVSAKNTLQNISGYSPNQLVFGSNFILPSVDSDAPPAMNTATSSNLVKETSMLYIKQEKTL